MPRQHQRIITLNYTSFLTLGLIGSTIGPSLPTLARQMDVGLDAAGGLVSSLSVGYLIAGLTAGPIVDALGRRPVYLASLGIQTFSLLSILFAPSLAMGMLAFFLLGLGQGGIDIAVHVIIGDAAGQKRGAALNRVHIFFGLGGLVGPIVTGYGLKMLGNSWPSFASFSLLTLLILCGVILTPLPTRRQASQSAATNTKSVLARGTFWILALFFVLCVGVEVGIGTWIFAFLSKGLDAQITLASWSASGFYLAITAGRLAGSKFAGRQARDVKLVLIGLGGALGGLLLLWTGGMFSSVWLFIAGVLVVGFCFGPVYPTAMGLTQQRFPSAAGTAIGLITAGASLGAVSIPWLLGWLLTHNGLLWSVAAAGMFTLILLSVGVAAIPQRRQKQSSTVEF